LMIGRTAVQAIDSDFSPDLPGRRGAEVRC
jgi:hypothetical protein